MTQVEEKPRCMRSLELTTIRGEVKVQFSDRGGVFNPDEARAVIDVEPPGTYSQVVGFVSLNGYHEALKKESRALESYVRMRNRYKLSFLNTPS